MEIVAEVVFAVFALLGVFFLTELVGRLFEKSALKERSSICQGVQKCVVHVWPGEDADYVESILRRLSSIHQRKNTCCFQFVLECDTSSDEVLRICKLYAQHHPDMSVVGRERE